VAACSPTPRGPRGLCAACGVRRGAASPRGAGPDAAEQRLPQRAHGLHLPRR
jgi:hypothetical protein